MTHDDPISPQSLSAPIQGERSSIFDLARGRLSLLATLFILLYVVIAARVIDLSIVQGVLLQIHERPEMSMAQNTLPVRGEIFDRNGALLATTLKSESLFVNQQLVHDPAGVASALQKIFPDLSKDDLIARLSGRRSFVWLVRNITPAQKEAIMMIGEPALGFETDQRRVYPQGPLAAHLVGYTDIDGRGLSGLERSLNETLESGRDPVLTTLDIRLQHALDKELAATMDEFKAVSASGVIMEIKSGAILAGGSWPRFNPNHIGQTSTEERFNHLTLGVYELGSIFKIFSTAALINEGEQLSRTFDARKPLAHGRFKIRDYHAEKRVMSVPEVFMHSSNIGSALMGQELGADVLKRYYRDLGLLEQLSFCIRETGRPLVPRPWREINTLTAAYGHGIAVSPLQLAAAVASSIGDGTYKQPYLVTNMSGPKPARRVFKEHTTEKMRQLLRLNALEGTGKFALVKGYEIGGKTGTAEKIKPGGGYDRDRKIASFVSVFPASDPEYLVLVVVDEPIGHSGSHGFATGGWVAAPATARIVKHMVRILGLKPTETDENIEFVRPLLKYVQSDDKVAEVY